MSILLENILSNIKLKKTGIETIKVLLALNRPK